jgi:hypothetical protein
MKSQRVVIHICVCVCVCECTRFLASISDVTYKNSNVNTARKKLGYLFPSQTVLSHISHLLESSQLLHFSQWISIYAHACVLFLPRRVTIQQVLGCAGHFIYWDYILIYRYDSPKFTATVIKNYKFT